MNKNSIGILGHGFVGKILKRYYPEATAYDIVDSPNKLEDVLNKEIIFVAINFKDNCLSKESDDILQEYFKQMKDGTIVIIKSTFVPGSCDLFQSSHPNLRFVYNCEFLTEATAWEDFIHPQFQILGCPYQSLDLVNDLFGLLPDAPVKRVISPLDAELLKHALNSYYATKVTWFNQLYDVCKLIGSDYETLREIMMQNSWIGDSHSVVYHKGYRGFGGKCLSKDPHNLTKISIFPLLEKVIEINNNYLKEQKLI